MCQYVLISVYFGKCPENFGLWLKSAAQNTGVDFLIVGDLNVSGFTPLPGNVHILSMTFEAFRHLAQSKFDFKIELNAPYKLCDYKPAYGYILQEHIADYTYWGHIDLDTILGNLSKYFPPVGEAYDKIYEYGHLCMYKNTSKNNMRFMLDGGMNYKNVFTTNNSMIFDETVGMQKKFEQLHAKIYLSNDFADIARRRLSFTLNEEICRPNYKYQIFYYEDGRVLRDFYKNGQIQTDEFNYIHFSHRTILDKTNGSSSFYITRFGFIPKDSATTLELIKKYNAPTPFQNIFCFFQVQVVRRIKRVIKLLFTK